MRFASRLTSLLAVAALLTVPAANAATPTATTATTQPSPGSVFGQPLQPPVGDTTPTETTVTATKRAGDTGTGRGTLLFLSLVALLMIAGVAGYIWYEGRQRASTQRRHRQRMRSGRTPQTLAATSADGRRGPPPPPRKRRQQAKRKKR